MSLSRAPTHFTRAWSLASRRTLATAASAEASTTTTPPPPHAAVDASGEPLTHYKITLRRSAISLPEKFKGTLTALGLRRRHQTVFQAHTPEAAGMILRVKELLEVSNVPASAVRTQGEQRHERKAPRGFTVERSVLGTAY
jgi:large subunit ribosomal protein L30